MKVSLSVRARVVALASLVALIGGAAVNVPAAAAAPERAPRSLVGLLRTEGTPLPPVPPLVTESWNGTTGIDATAERWRKAVADVAELSPEPEVRAAALAALSTGDPAAIFRFANVEKRQLEAAIDARKRQQAADNLVTIRAMAGTGGTHFNAEVQRVLAGTDTDRELFLAYGADVARQRDEKLAADARERAAQLRERLRVFAAAAPAESHVKAAAEQALAGDDAAIAAFWNTGYLAAAKADAAEREQYLKDLEARNKAAEELSDLAQRARRASEARTRLLRAHGDGVEALQRAANDMAGSANSARHAERVLARAGTAASKSAELNLAKSQTANFVNGARLAAEQARTAAAIATSAADELIATGLDYGAEWSLIAQGMSEASAAALGAATTAQHAIDATIATNNAQGAQAQAEAHAKQAEQWRKHAQEHAAAAARLATAAAKQAAAAKTAAQRTKKAREEAQAAEAKAWAAAERTNRHRETAEARAAEAKQARQVAEAERANAARFRAEAEQHAATARTARGNAEAQAAAANRARGSAEGAERNAKAARDRSWNQERIAASARDEAIAAERAEQAAKARARALKAVAASAAGQADSAEAQRYADEADAQAGAAGTAARNARSAANTATGAAANSRAAAHQAQQAANRAWAAARQAEAAARAADAAADRAEATAQQTHSHRMRADAKAAVATTNEIRAAEAATAAVNLAGQAADEAVQSLWSANRTRDEAQAATTEAVAAAAQADIAIAAASAASSSSAGIAEPHNTAIGMVTPFTGADIDADFVALVAQLAQTIGEEQAEAARARAAEAVRAAELAEAAAQRANDQVKPAYTAAAQAARSAAQAAQSAAEAKQSAAQAAVDGAAARTAAASAARADAQARADALAARQAANEAANDAAIAGRSAAAAQNDANAADSAATRAESDAAAARGAADRAESDAAAARTAADNAQDHADSAAEAASRALQHATEAQQAAERAEAAERQRQQDQASNAGAPAPGEEDDLLKYLTPEQRAEYEKAKQEAGQSILDFLKAEGLDFLIGLIVPEDLMECVKTPNFEACFWTIIELVPWGKLKKIGNVWDLYKKWEKFADKVRNGRKKRDDIADDARRSRDACKIKPPVPGNGRVAALADPDPFPCDDVDAAGWPVPNMDNCKACAKKIKELIGGETFRLSDSMGAPKLGPSKHDPTGRWDEHFVVIKDGVVYDGFTGPKGMPLKQYRAQWTYGEYLDFKPVDLD
ncbi:hypothetical protein JIG36_04975 [Actinoplanes sp. LDG1-06]|uniref:Methyl-accepting transducer domain-containing protein n=1 Tax=Paractinoplanes ovalisporus TaxID=2810368 RepID=A0ABS2A4Y3_9ACTN|nr:hypothetical protein [Actinoplanes ovalisporus]MBM2614910.1 hypothetical protein [Actinoplanes ovalisporus]